MPKFLFFDIDGTLVNRKNEVPESAWKAIEETRRQGNYCFICSGRNLPSTQTFPCPELDGIIYCSGAGIQVNGEIIYEDVMDLEKLKHLIQMFDQFDSGYTLFHRIHGFSNHIQQDAFKSFAKVLNRPVQEVLDIYSIVDFSNWNDDPILKIDATIPFVHLEQFQKELDPVFEWLSIGEAGKNDVRKYGEVNTRGTSKGSAIRKVMEYFNAPISDAYGFGDSMNDYSMLHACGTSIAMGNSEKKILDLADYITDDVDNDGIANAMKNFHLF